MTSWTKTVLRPVVTDPAGQVDTLRRSKRPEVPTRRDQRSRRRGRATNLEATAKS